MKRTIFTRIHTPPLVDHRYSILSLEDGDGDRRHHMVLSEMSAILGVKPLRTVPTIRTRQILRLTGRTV